jgi:hypothetical protein
MATGIRKRGPNVSQTWPCCDCSEDHVFGHISKDRDTGPFSNWHGTGFNAYVRFRMQSRFGGHHVETIEMRTQDLESIIDECNQLRRFHDSVLALIDGLPENTRIQHGESTCTQGV